MAIISAKLIVIASAGSGMSTPKNCHPVVICVVHDEEDRCATLYKLRNVNTAQFAGWSNLQDALIPRLTPK